MEAKVTITMNPREFDLLRESVTARHKAAHETAAAVETEVKARHEARQTAVALSDLLLKLQ